MEELFDHLGKVSSDFESSKEQNSSLTHDNTTDTTGEIFYVQVILKHVQPLKRIVN